MLIVVAMPVLAGVLRAQELEPGAYSPSPIGFNILVAGATYNKGDVNFDPAAPIDEAYAKIRVATTGYVRTFGLAGRLANVGVGLPYVRGDIDGLVLGQPQSAYRSGWGDPRVRFAINLHGVPAMTPKEFASYQQKTNVGASVVVGIPLGKYDSTKLINIGSNRWSFKPEIGISHAAGRWTFEGYAGAWFFTDNTDFYNGGLRKQEPIGSLQAHVIYTIRPRMWVAVNANYYAGGRTTLNGTENFDLQRNSRVGLTFALPIHRQHSVKLTLSRGAMTNIGADFDSFGISYQYIWR